MIVLNMKDVTSSHAIIRIWTWMVSVIIAALIAEA